MRAAPPQELNVVLAHPNLRCDNPLQSQDRDSRRHPDPEAKNSGACRSSFGREVNTRVRAPVK